MSAKTYTHRSYPAILYRVATDDDAKERVFKNKNGIPVTGVRYNSPEDHAGLELGNGVFDSPDLAMSPEPIPVDALRADSSAKDQVIDKLRDELVHASNEASRLQKVVDDLQSKLAASESARKTAEKDVEDYKSIIEAADAEAKKAESTGGKRR